MSLTRKRLEEMARAETVIIEPRGWTNCSPEEWRELVEAALALRLLQEAGERDMVGHRCGWLMRPDGELVHGEPVSVYPNPTPQAAVIAALGPKGASDAE